MAWETIEGWRAGRVWRNKAGKLSYYIRRDGKDHATGASTLRGALDALDRYEKTGDPRPPESVAVVLEDTDDEKGLAAEFLGYLKTKGDSKEWRRNVRQHLAWWTKQIGGRDLRAGRRDAVTITILRTALDGAPSAAQREKVIRALYSFLRGADRIATAEDPTYGKPRIAPPSRPAQDKIDKSIDRSDVETMIGYLDAKWSERGKNDEERSRRGRGWGDLLRLLDGTGMHVTELRRFAESGAIEALPGGRKATDDEAAVLVIPLHKSGAPFRMAVSKATVKAARRVREAGTFSLAVFYDVLRKAAKKSGARVLPGRFRHTTAKHALEAGATVQEIATFLGHKSPATTKKFYASLGVPMKVPTRR